jgi:hypothetical protein
MTKKELYTCDICHTDYCNKETALQCEKDHFKCVKITDARYIAHFKLPHKIEVEFSDGTRRWYKQ